MDLQTIYLIVSLALDGFIALLVLLKGNSKADTTTIQELAEKAQAKADIYFKKQLKKHNLSANDFYYTGGEDESKTDEIKD